MGGWAECGPGSFVVLCHMGGAGWETGTESEADTESEAGTDSDAGIEFENYLESEAGRQLHADTDHEAGTESEAGTDPEAGMEFEDFLESEACAESEALTISEASTGSEAGTEAEVGTESEAEHELVYLGEVVEFELRTFEELPCDPLAWTNRVPWYSTALSNAMQVGSDMGSAAVLVPRKPWESAIGI